MKDHNYSELCLHYITSRTQRQTELNRGQGLKGTQSYELRACYSCGGYDISCPAYTKISKRALKIIMEMKNV